MKINSNRQIKDDPFCVAGFFILAKVMKSLLQLSTPPKQ